MDLKRKCIIDTIVYILLVSILSFIVIKLGFFPINFVRTFYAGTCFGVIAANITWYFLWR